MTIAQLSDPHIRVGPDDQGSANALAKAVAAVLALTPLPSAVLVTGDLAEHAAPAEYERFDELVEPLPMPVHVLPGNHDDLDWPGPHTVDCDGTKVVLCDTHIPGRDDGHLDVEWLAGEIGDGPTIVAMHHPPILTGLDALDAIGLPEHERAALAELLARSPQVTRVTAGHVHRTAFATLGGRQVTTCASTNLQAKLEFGSPGFTILPEPPAFLVHAGAVAHVQPV
ncbi:MAG TPA: metallophosphoesterase [Solirubrobacteraceae bacterium]|nr:metallophosphoesterase [Solirubrobacteraceae bacterium]